MESKIVRKKLNSNRWVPSHEKPPKKDGEPIEVEMLTDYDGEILEGYYEGGTWWIKLKSPSVGHRDFRSFDIDFEITHWRSV